MYYISVALFIIGIGILIGSSICVPRDKPIKYNISYGVAALVIVISLILLKNSCIG